MNGTPARYFYLLNREKAGIIGGGYNWWGLFYLEIQPRFGQVRGHLNRDLAYEDALERVL